MRKLLGLIVLLTLYVTAQSQTTIVNGLQVNGAKGTAPSQALPVNGGIAYFDGNGILKKTTAVAGLGAKVTSVTATSDSTLSIATDAGTTAVLVRGLFTNSRQRYFDSLRSGLIFDTIHVVQVGAGINPVYSNASGTTLLVKGLVSSGTIEVRRQSDSSLIFNCLLAFPASITATGSNQNQVQLVGDLQTPADFAVYGKQGGSKGWYASTSFPVATTTTNGLESFQHKNRVDSIVNITNYTSGGLYDSIAVASPSLDSVILKGLRIRGATGSGITVTNQGNIFANDYVIDFTGGTGSMTGATVTRSGDGTTSVFTIPHGLSGVTSSSTVVVTPRSAAIGTGYYYVTVDATNRTITYSTAPGAGTNNLTWSYMIKP